MQGAYEEFYYSYLFNTITSTNEIISSKLYLLFLRVLKY